jgi:hypothetical protein
MNPVADGIKAANNMLRKIPTMVLKIAIMTDSEKNIPYTWLELAPFDLRALTSTFLVAIKVSAAKTDRKSARMKIGRFSIANGIVSTYVSTRL